VNANGSSSAMSRPGSWNPQAVGEDDEPVGVRPRFVVRESTAEERAALQRREEGRRDGHRAQLFRIPPLVQVRRPPGEQRRILDRRRLGLAVDVVGDRDARLIEIDAAVAVPDEDEAVRVRIRQRTQQRLVEEREDRRVGADPERQSEDGN
jgi:hypothetical protein